MTLFEVVIVIVAIIILAVFLLPDIFFPSYGSKCSLRYSCANNLKQLALGYKIWAGDNNDHYPMELSVTNGGVKEWMNTPDAWKAYLVMSNELSTPKIIFCPQDPSHGDCPTQWNDALKYKISYFIGLDATDSNPSAILSGDGNWRLDNAPANHGFVNASTNATLAWDNTRHLSESRWFRPRTVYDNVVLCDGGVQMLDNAGLARQLQQTGFATNRFFVP